MDDGSTAPIEVDKSKMLAPSWKDSRAEREKLVRSQLRMNVKYNIIRDPQDKRLYAPNKKVKDPLAYEEAAKTLVGHLLIENGVGLAANQMGLNVQMCAVRAPDMDGKVVVFFNPRLIDAPEYLDPDKQVSNMKWDIEGCVSHPGIWAEVARANKIVFRASTLTVPQEKTYKAEGMFARVLQHEIDHLNGRLITDLGMFKRNIHIDPVGQAALFETNRLAEEFGRDDNPEI